MSDSSARKICFEIMPFYMWLDSFWQGLTQFRAIFVYLFSIPAFSKNFKIFEMASNADDPKDVLDFKFRSIRNVKVRPEGEDEEPTSKTPTQKLAVANSLGLLFAGKIPHVLFGTLIYSKVSLIQQEERIVFGA